MHCERLRQQAEDFHRMVEEEIRTTRALIEDVRVRQAKRRRDGNMNGLKCFPAIGW